MDLGIPNNFGEINPNVLNLLSSSENTPLKGQEGDIDPLSLSVSFSRYRLSQTVPDELICPVTHELLQEPYSNELGHTYEKSVLERLIKEHHPDPLTQQPFTQMFPNFGIKKLAQRWKEHHQEVVVLGFPYLQERNEQKALIHIEAAKKFASHQNYEDAEDSYKEALRFTDSTETYQEYAELIARAGKTEKAYKAFYELGKWYAKNEQLECAKKSYERAKTYHADREELLEALIAVYKQLDDKVSTATILKEIGLAYKKKELYSQACDAYEEAFTLSKDKSCLEALIEIHEAQKDNQTVFIKQKQLFELEIETDPENLSAYARYRQILKANGDQKTAYSIKQKRETIIQNLRLKVQSLDQRLQQLEERVGRN